MSYMMSQDLPSSQMPRHDSVHSHGQLQFLPVLKSLRRSSIEADSPVATFHRGDCCKESAEPVSTRPRIRS